MTAPPRNCAASPPGTAQVRPCAGADLATALERADGRCLSYCVFTGTRARHSPRIFLILFHHSCQMHHLYALSLPIHVFYFPLIHTTTSTLVSLTSPLFTDSPLEFANHIHTTTSTLPHPHICHILTTTFTPPHSHNHIHTTTFSKPHSHYTLTQPHSHNTSDKQIGGEKNQWRERNCGKLLPIGPVTKKRASLRRKRPSCGSKN